MRKKLKISDFININNFRKSCTKFKNNKPFDHCICENFFKKNIAKKLELSFPKYNEKFLHEYNNPIENKKTLNSWNYFSPIFYEIFTMLNSNEFISFLEKNLKIKKLYPDYGLNGGGLHISKKSGKLNPHLDYNIHPKMFLQRKLNIIVYLTSNWKKKWGGELGFYESNKNRSSSKKLIKNIDLKFNKAVLFDTTQESWHGIVNKLDTPKNVYRKSLAIYYLTNAATNTENRSKALFAPTKSQEKNKDILKLIKMRSSIKKVNKTYKI